MSKPEILFEFKYRDEIIQFCADQNFYGPGSDILDDGKIVRWASREAFWIEVANHYRAQLAQAEKTLEAVKCCRRVNIHVRSVNDGDYHFDHTVEDVESPDGEYVLFEDLRAAIARVLRACK